MQLITIPFVHSRKEISSEEMKLHSQSCKHDCVLLLARLMCKSIIFIHLCLKSFVPVDYVIIEMYRMQQHLCLLY